MKKETLIAIFLGILFGVIVAGVLLFKTKDSFLKSNKPIFSTAVVTPAMQASQKKQFQTFELLEPETGSIVDGKSVTIQGKAAQDSLIVFQSPISTVTLRNSKEDFSQAFPVALGENVIHISVYPKDQQASVQEKDLKVYYLQ